jgi:hypothetical protein
VDPTRGGSLDIDLSAGAKVEVDEDAGSSEIRSDAVLALPLTELGKAVPELPEIDPVDRCECDEWDRLSGNGVRPVPRSCDGNGGGPILLLEPIAFLVVVLVLELPTPLRPLSSECLVDPDPASADGLIPFDALPGCPSGSVPLSILVLLVCVASSTFAPGLIAEPNPGRISLASSLTKTASSCFASFSTTSLTPYRDNVSVSG